MYDQSKTVVVSNRNPAKKATLRLPSAEQMMARIRAQKTVRTSLGRGKGKSNPVIDLDGDLELFNALKVSGDDFSAIEARIAIQRITLCDASCEKKPEGYVVTVDTPFGELTHTLREPTEEEMFTYSRGSSDSMELKNNREELWWIPEAGVKLYDAVLKKSEGYAEGTEVPVHHKCTVAAKLAEAIAELDPQIEIGPNS